MNLHFHDHAFTRLKQSCTLGLPASAAREIRSLLESDFALHGITEIEDAAEPYRSSSSPDLPTFAERLRSWVSRVRRDIIGWFRRPPAPVHVERHYFDPREIFYEHELDDNGDPCGSVRLVNEYDEEVDTFGELVFRDSAGQLI